MSETLAGVTLLAFGNGSPDIFASLANTQGDTELMYTELLGAAAFVTGFIGGFVILTRPFKIIRRNNLRDVLFFLAAIIYIDLTIHDGTYSLWEGVATCSIYLVYIVYVLLDHLWMKNKVAKLRKMSSLVSVIGARASDIQKEVIEMEEIVEIQIKSRRTTSVIEEPEILKVFTVEEREENKETLIRTFVKSLNPIDGDWSESGKFSRIMMIVKVS